MFLFFIVSSTFSCTLHFDFFATSIIQILVVNSSSVGAPFWLQESCRGFITRHSINVGVLLLTETCTYIRIKQTLNSSLRSDTKTYDLRINWKYIRIKFSRFSQFTIILFRHSFFLFQQQDYFSLLESTRVPGFYSALLLPRVVYRQTFIDFSRYTNPLSSNISHWRF